MSNNQPNYDDLAFEPKLKFEELKSWAKDFCEKNDIYFEVFFGQNNCFWAGELCFFDNGYVKDVSELIISEDRTYEQMQAVIKLLYED